MTSPTDPDAGRALPPLPEHDTYGIDIDDRETELWGADSMRAYAFAACAERDAEVERLQLALFRWLPHVRGTGSEQDEASATDAFLLIGLESDCACYGERILQRAEAAEARVNYWADLYQKDADDRVAIIQERDALRARLDSAQKQEPVAWIYRDRFGDICVWMLDALGDDGLPAYTAPPLLTDSAVDDDNAPTVECWNGEKKVTIYPTTVLRSWGKNIDTEMSDEPRTLKSVDDAMRWLYGPLDSAVFWHGIYPEGGAEMAQEMQRLREVIAGLRAQIADGGEWRTKLTDALAKVMELTLQIEKIKKQPAISELWTNEERKIYSKGGKELIERPELP